MKLSLVFLLSFLRLIESLVRNDTCTNPNGSSGRCISFGDCKQLQEYSKKHDEDAIDLTRQSICGIDTEVLVCCLTTETKEPSNPRFRGKDDDTTIGNPLTGENSDVFPNRSICGFQKAVPKIIGGEVAELSEFPWMVALEYRSVVGEKYKGLGCSGSLINSRYVLTAAHCLFYPGLELSAVRLGEWDITTDPDCQIINGKEECADKLLRLKIKKQITHPFFQRKSLIHDIALLQLEQTVTYTDYIRPICLPIQDQPLPPLHTNMTVAGWGVTENGVTSHVKLKVLVPLVESFKCIDTRGYITSEICAGGVEGKDSCNGDSGGPLMKSYDNSGLLKPQWFQEGLVSWGSGCGRARSPAVYTRIGKYMKWIESTIKNGESPPCNTPPPSDNRTRTTNNNTNNSWKDTQIFPDKRVCGFSNQSLGISGEIELNEYPWTVVLEYKSTINGEYNGILCGGSLIHKRYVLTAAICVVRPEFELIKIILGKWNLRTDRKGEIENENTLKIKVRKQISYPSDPWKNNIALLQLEHDVTYTDYIRPICLPAQNEAHLPVGTKMTVAGWGANVTGLASRIKFKAPALPSKCDEQFQQAGNYCLVREEGKTPCYGNAGSPLMKTYDGKQKHWYQEGVIVQKPGCKTLLDSLTYIKVSNYRNWIESTIRNEEKPSKDIPGQDHSGSDCVYNNLENDDHPSSVEDKIYSDHNIKTLPTEEVCGIERVKARIVGGEVTEIGESPWIVALEYTSKITNVTAGIRCGGTLINNQYVLTAAHCILDSEFQLKRAWLGDWNISSDPDCIRYGSYNECSNVLKIHIKKSIPHHLYSRRRADNDIGLLKLVSNIKYTDYIRPICLPLINQQLPLVGTRMIVAGWGATENGTISDVKLKVSVPLASDEQCLKKVLDFLNGNQICAGGEKGKDSCRGDSGGPLMTVHKDPITQQEQWYQEGIVSFGIGCGKAEYPGVYTKVSRYIHWIRQTIQYDVDF